MSAGHGEASTAELFRALVEVASPDLAAGLSAEVLGLLEPLWSQLDDLAVSTPPATEPAVRFVPEPHPTGREPGGLANPLPPAGAAGAPEEGDLEWLSAREVIARIRAGSLRSGQLLTVLAARVERLQPQINAFITVTESAARAAVSQGRPGRLAGLPVALKDLIDTAGVLTTCGSNIYRTRVPSQDAACWELLRDEGAVLFGKANTHEFAAGVTSVNDAFGPVRNPWDASRMAGGSSGGSAAAVAAGLVPASLGSDTGGSVRIPASCCGVVGVKPTFGRVPGAGVHPLAWSMDTVGPITRDVADAGLLLDVLTGAQACESAAEGGVGSRLDSVTVALPVAWLTELDDGVGESFWRAVAALRRRGARVVEVHGLPSLDRLLAVNRTIAYAEGSAVHGHLRSRRHLYGAGIRARMEAGRFISAEHYLLAQRVRSQWCQMLAGVWSQAQLLVTPVLPCRAPELTATTAPVGGRQLPLGSALVMFTGPFSLAGVPAMSLPTELLDGLPTAVQLVGPADSEALLCFVGAAWEHELPPSQHPPLAVDRA